MNLINTLRIKNSFAEKFGIALNVKSTTGKVEIRPDDLEYGEGFKIIIVAEWRNLSAELIPDNFSGHLLRAMGQSVQTKKELFRVIAEKYLLKYNDLKMSINGVNVDPLKPKYWDDNWNQLGLKLLKSPIISTELTNVELENAIIEISSDFLNLILSLLPLEETAEEESIQGLPEGDLAIVKVNRYERSQINRQACLAINGHVCKVCNFNFETTYGFIGVGFIHVHHIVPVSKLGAEYVLNPKTDLVPLCPNCHAMIHKRNPSYSLDELKEIIIKNKSKNNTGASY
ncbi:HNH endonuclease [Sutcliffiella horikoshii]|uniref:HNH endonuclease n=1 Tax=Sutcliffiella horikoshii TaxID=79883 RepID=UPI003CE780DA